MFGRVVGRSASVSRIGFPAASMQHGRAAGGRIASGYTKGGRAHSTFYYAGQMDARMRRATEAGDLSRARLYQDRAENLRSSGRAYMGW